MASQIHLDGILRAKYFYTLAAEQSASKHSLAAGVVVSQLQDAVEALAYTVALSRSVQLSQVPSFHQYWEQLDKAGSSLPYKGEMSELNHARVGFKHKGTLVAESAMEKFVRNTHRFLSETSEKFFNVNFDALSEVDLIQDAGVRSLLRAATDHLERDEIHECLHLCRDAIDVLDKQLGQVVVLSHPARPSRAAQSSELFVWAATQLSTLEKTLALTIIGISPTDYWLLHAMLPSKSLGNTYHFVRPANAPPINIDTAAETIGILVRNALRIEAAADRLKHRARSFIPGGH